jgi:hypothetical protein
MATALPLAVGLLAILGTFTELSLLGRITDVAVYAINLTTALALVLGVDYALLMAARYRELAAQGVDARTAVVTTVQTAGRTILSSAATVTLVHQMLEDHACGSSIRSSSRSLCRVASTSRVIKGSAAWVIRRWASWPIPRMVRRRSCRTAGSGNRRPVALLHCRPRPSRQFSHPSGPGPAHPIRGEMAMSFSSPRSSPARRRRRIMSRRP